MSNLNKDSVDLAKDEALRQRIATINPACVVTCVEEFVDPAIEKRQTAIARERGFALADHALSLYAHCQKPDCPHRPSH